MAIPKVFVSSTCFDLGEIREQLKRFIRSYGFDPVLSENGDVFYHPELHTHESCIHEISHCQLFILIIGGRFGGSYTQDKKKSITNAEYEAARHHGIPIFTYVKNNVISDRHLYSQNKKKEFVSDIEYPSIEKQMHAIDIFNFVDDVHRSMKNNAVEGFNVFQDIEDHLRKQWAGLIFHLLKSRGVSAQIDATNNLIEKLSSSSEKLEEIVKSFYKSSNKENAEKEIADIEKRGNIESFFESVLRPSGLVPGSFYLDEQKIDIDIISKISPSDRLYTDYLLKTKMFELYETFDRSGINEKIDFSKLKPYLRCVVDVLEGGFAIPYDNMAAQILYDSSVKNSSEAQRKIALSKVIEKYSLINNIKNIDSLN
ncbi:DUF4062 domain-containing protein [Undibacterium sp. TC4M20W]|uniref:DUF4062 domain-containing protein n=1 Tax=Undibacterium sp. TC4M20W TaxID=3413052 RepID=UPI003BF1A85E